LLLEHGFTYESSMMGNDYTPYYARQGDEIRLEEPCVWGEPTRLVEMPISWTLDDYPHFEFVRTQAHVLQGLMNARNVLENWLDDFVYMQCVFHAISITDSTAKRSPIPRHFDH
jgi:hypothetical protein